MPLLALRFGHARLLHDVLEPSRIPIHVIAFVHSSRILLPLGEKLRAVRRQGVFLTSELMAKSFQSKFLSMGVPPMNCHCPVDLQCYKFQTAILITKGQK
eukprot:scaffold148235_cov18-Prasinocladus_malaysianus.AAC.1